MGFHPEALFSEPGGWESARIFLLAAVAFSIFGAIELLSNTGTSFNVVLAIGMGVAGIAELLPTHRQRLASVLRIMAIAVLLSVVGMSLVSVVS